MRFVFVAFFVYEYPLYVNKVPFLLFSLNSIAGPLNTVWSRVSQQCFIFVQPSLIVFAITTCCWSYRWVVDSRYRLMR